MIKKDYIQRYIDELSKILAVVLQLKQNNEPDKAEDQLNDFSTDYLGVTIQTILKIAPEILINKLIDEHQFTITHFKLSEDVLYHYYLLHPNNKAAKKCTLEVLKHLTQTDIDFSGERDRRIKELTL